MGDIDTGMKTETWLDRTGWDAGPWDDEPDRAEWTDRTGFPCLALRHAHYGVWCGYVAMPPGHRWHGQSYEDVSVEVHGGLTFSGPCDNDEGPQRARICHVPAPGEPDDVWWLGFDCGHAMDVKANEPMKKILGDFPDIADIANFPPDLSGYGGFERTYRTLDYVRDQCALLASQAAEA